MTDNFTASPLVKARGAYHTSRPAGGGGGFLSTKAGSPHRQARRPEVAGPADRGTPPPGSALDEVFCSCNCAACARCKRDDDLTGDNCDDGSSAGGNPNAPGLADGTSLASHATFDVRAATDEGKIVLEGTPTVYDFDYSVLDRHGCFTERMAPHAAAGCVTQDVMFQFDHGGLPLARTPATLTLWDTPHALRCRATFNDSQTSRDLYAAIEAGNVAAMSIGMVVDDDEWNSAYTVRVVKRIGRLIDVSAVGLPANTATAIWIAGSEDARQRQRNWARRRIAQLHERRAA